MKMNYFYSLAFLPLFALADMQEAKEMFDEAKCMECHNISDFGGSTSKAKDYHQLLAKVDACQRGNDAEWFDEDSGMVADYLNKVFYKFKKHP